MSAIPDCTPNLADAGNDSLRRRRWRRRMLRIGLIVLILLGAAILFHGPLLRGLASRLIVEDSLPENASLVLLGGVGGYDRVAPLLREGSGRRLLLLDRYPDRLVSFGLLPPSLEIDRRMLRARGVSTSKLIVLPGQVGNDWDVARRLGEWLEEHPGDRLAVFCPRFRSQRMRRIFQVVLREDARRVHLQTLAPPGYDETNWWRHKEGLLEVLNSGLSLGYVYLAGEGGPPRRAWHPDEIEEMLR